MRPGIRGFLVKRSIRLRGDSERGSNVDQGAVFDTAVVVPSIRGRWVTTRWSQRRWNYTPETDMVVPSLSLHSGGDSVDRTSTRAHPAPLRNSIKPTQQQKRRAAPHETGRPGVVVSQEATRDQPKELLLPLPLLTHAHGHVDGSALEAKGLAQAALDEAAVTGIQEAGGEQHELGRP